MRLHEIKTPDVHDIIHRYFKLQMGYQLENGVVSTDGDVLLMKRCKKLPIKFGKVGGVFNATKKGLTTLEGFPIASQSIVIKDNQLTSFIGGPKIVHGNLVARYNPFISLEGLPEVIDNNFWITITRELPLLRLLFVDNVRNLQLERGGDLTEQDCIIIRQIINKYKWTRRKGAIQCAAELTKAGFKRNAKL